MYPDLATIIRYRYAAVAVIRLGAVGCAVMVFWPLAELVTLPLRQSGGLGYVRTQIMSQFFAWLNPAPAIVGGALLFLAGPLSRWIVPMPRPGCVNCGYRLAGVTPKPELGLQCPECGTVQPPVESKHA